MGDPRIFGEKKNETEPIGGKGVEKAHLIDCLLDSCIEISNWIPKRFAI